MSWEIVRGDARALPLADASVDLIACSPPYWGLRSYRDGGEHYDGQIGSEPTPQQWVDEMVGMIDAEWRRVLKPEGSLFLNLGDRYNNRAITRSSSHQGGLFPERKDDTIGTTWADLTKQGRTRLTDSMTREKSLLGLPWRVALALIDRGWILRAEIIWAKPNGLPESVTDRVRRSHEQIFHFTLEPRYFSAVDEIREAHARDWQGERGLLGTSAWAVDAGRHDCERPEPPQQNPLGRLPGSVWTIPTSPLIVPDQAKQHYSLPDHFAAYPPELVRRIIPGWSPKEVCVRCGEGRRPVVEKDYTTHGHLYSNQGGMTHRSADNGGKGSTVATVVGEACACPTPDNPTTPGVVCDPMCGTGTTVGVAHKLGRHGIGVDLSEDYCRLARWRIEASGDFDTVESRTWQDRQLTIEEG